jgi:adenylate cyclase
MKGKVGTISPVARVLIVDDDTSSQKVLSEFLSLHEYECLLAGSAEAALDLLRDDRNFDLAILDLRLPGMSGFGACIALRRMFTSAELPILMVTGSTAIDERMHGFEIGADEFLTKPVRLPELLARVRTLTVIKMQFSRVTAAAVALDKENKLLEKEITSRVAENKSLQSLRKFLSPTLLEAIKNVGLSGDVLPNPLRSHRREIAVVVIDIRGFTELSLTLAPEDLMITLGIFHHVIGEAASAFDGTIERFTGDGVLVFFNDPIPQNDFVQRAHQFAVAVQTGCLTLKANSVSGTSSVKVGIGVAKGYATLGEIGSDSRRDYAAIGPVTVLANRLCMQAAHGEILMPSSFADELGIPLEHTSTDELSLKGFESRIAFVRLRGDS